MKTRNINVVLMMLRPLRVQILPVAAAMLVSISVAPTNPPLPKVLIPKDALVTPMNTGAALMENLLLEVPDRYQIKEEKQFNTCILYYNIFLLFP